MIDEIKAVVADIDMTLTAKGGELPAATIEAFRILHEHDVLLGLGTGREISEKLKTQGRDWGLGFEFDFVVGMNGGMVLDRFHKDMWQVELLTTQEMKDILNYMMPLIDKYHISVNAEGGGNHNAMYIQGELLASSRRHGFDFVDKTGDVDGFCERRAFKMLFRTEPEYEQEIRDTFLAKFGDNFQIIGTFPGTVEVMHKGIDKGSGVRRFADGVGIDMQNIIAFGDNENDNTMLVDCGWGVCLKDGSDGTKACADAITDYDCQEGGVGHYLIDYYLKPKGWM